MAGREAAREALRLTVETQRRLAGLGVSAEQMPPVDAIYDMVWPLARKLVRSAKRVRVMRECAAYHAARAEETARAVSLALDARVECLRQVAAADLRQLVEFDPAGWHVALVPGAAPAGDGGLVS